MPDTPPLLQCPVGEPHCKVIDTVSKLERELLELRDMVHTDTLTGISNFRQFRLILDQEIERTRRTGTPTALIMLDLDHFKQVNDRWGHEAGNQALILTATNLKENVRVLDTPCRYGGEEFAIILPSTTLLVARQVAERLRKAIEHSDLTFEGNHIGLTASLGVAILQHSDSVDAEGFIHKADQQLYLSKKGGRNKVSYLHTETPDQQNQVNPEEKDALANLFKPT